MFTSIVHLIVEGILLVRLRGFQTFAFVTIIWTTLTQPRTPRIARE